MQLDKKLFCHWDLVRFVTEDHLKQKDGTFLTLSFTEDNDVELMIFLGKDDSSSDYEVRVYKNKPSDTYVPDEHDNVKKYEENQDYASFFFDEFKKAHYFADWIPYIHPEYTIRPTRKIVKD